VRNVEVVLFPVVLGTVVAAFAGRLRIPAPSLLVIAGLGRLYDEAAISQATRLSDDNH
jgi:hypothetical protein